MKPKGREAAGDESVGTGRIRLPRSRPKVSHAAFCVLFPTLVFALQNAPTLHGLAKWFYLKDSLDYLGLGAFLLIGLCAFVIAFTLLAHRWTIKPVAMGFAFLGGLAAYFNVKYGAVVDSGMLLTALHTDASEVHALLSYQMIPYLSILIGVPLAVVLSVEVTFERPRRYLFSSAKVVGAALGLSLILAYARFDVIHRATNLSRKYILHATVPVNYIQASGSALQHAITPYFRGGRAKKVEVSGQVTSREDLVVVLAIGETSRRQNFSAYGYSRQDTTPVLSRVAGLHFLDGVARCGSTLQALPEILLRRDVPLPTLTSRLGIDTSCYVNYTLYGLCDAVGETAVADCGHGGKCYDEDVLPLLSRNLASYTSGPRLVILHLGGGSHGPSYHERYPPEFRRFLPMCLDADVVNRCTPEELYNSYDNSILYVDHLLGRIIQELDDSSLPYVFIYLSDHGESLMEDGHLFHGMPPGVPLPPEQAHIPLIVRSSIKASIVERDEYTQQDVYDTVLGLLSIETDLARKDHDFIRR